MKNLLDLASNNSFNPLNRGNSNQIDREKLYSYAAKMQVSIP